MSGTEADIEPGASYISLPMTTQGPGRHWGYPKQMTLNCMDGSGLPSA